MPRILRQPLARTHCSGLRLNECFSVSLSQDCGLVSLHLSWSDVADEGASALAHCLPRQEQLRRERYSAIDAFEQRGLFCLIFFASCICFLQKQLKYGFDIRIVMQHQGAVAHQQQN